MRDRRQQQAVRQGEGDRCGDKEVAQTLSAEPQALAARQQQGEQQAAGADGDDEGPEQRRGAAGGSQLADRRRQAEQPAGDQQQPEGRVPDRLHRRSSPSAAVRPKGSRRRSPARRAVSVISELLALRGSRRILAPGSDRAMI